MMTIMTHKYNPLMHRKHLAHLLKNRELDPALIDTIPREGFVAYDLFQQEFVEYPVAAGFMRMVEGNMGMIDGFMTDPSFSSEARNEAINKITDKIVQLAKHYQMSGLFFLSESESILTRASERGFKSKPTQRVMSLDLEGVKPWRS